MWWKLARRRATNEFSGRLVRSHFDANRTTRSLLCVYGRYCAKRRRQHIGSIARVLCGGKLNRGRTLSKLLHHLLKGPIGSHVAERHDWIADQQKILVMTLIVGENFVSSDPKHLDRHAVQGWDTVALQIAGGSRKAHDDWIPLWYREDSLAEVLRQIR
jgi:hypothetical protein